MLSLRIAVDDDELRNLMARWLIQKRKTVEEGLVTVARTTCKAFMQYTVPSDNVKVESMVIGQVYSVYASQGQVYGEMFKNNEGAARAFWAATHGRRQIKRAAGILRAFGGEYASLPYIPFDGGAAHRAARGANGSVPNGSKPVMVVQSFGKKSPLTQYAKMRMNRVGMAKAGWVSAWRDLGRVRDVPKWVRRAEKASGANLGSAEMQFQDKANQRILLHNMAAHSSNAFEEKQRTLIQNEASYRLSLFLRLQLKDIKP